MLNGHWTYRSYRNAAELVGDDQRSALALIGSEGIFELRQSDDGRIEGGLGMADGLALRISGSIEQDAGFALIGEGLEGTATAGWRYDYRGIAGFMWPDATDQVPSLVGTVVRVSAHGPDAPAGFVASFIAVRHADNPPPRTARPPSSLVR